MAVEKRRGTTKQYYTRTRRVDGELKRDYIGALSDPFTGLCVRDDRLRKADALARKAELTDEIEHSKLIDARLTRIATWSSDWEVLSRIVALKPDGIVAMHTPTEHSLDLPKPQQFTRICRLAKQGDAEAVNSLNEWLDASPQMVTEATDFLEVARVTLVGGLSLESPESEALMIARLRLEAESIVDSVVDTPLNRLYADAVVLAWMDVVRCDFAGLRSNLSIHDRRYWESARGRALKRWGQVLNAFRQSAEART